MKTWDNFHPLVRPDAVMCPVPMVDQALMLTARDFCLRTAVWREWADTFYANGLKNRFDFDLPSGAELVKATRALVDGQDVTVYPPGKLPSDWQTATTSGGKTFLVHIDLLEFLICPKPAAGIAVAVEVALRPTMNATGVGDVVFERHAEAIAAGAKARLLAQPGKAWTELAAAAMARAEYERAVPAAANEEWRLTSDKRVRKAGI